MPTADEMIELLELRPLPHEGGYYAETYRAPEKLKHLPERYGSERAFSTAIYYLLTERCRSVMHRLESDEIFHFYAGDQVQMLQLHPDGTGRVVLLGQNFTAGEQWQVVVPQGTWQGARLAAGGRWALMGCTVAPGFEFADFELGRRDELVRMYPEFADTIRLLT
jgi:predicted cupin superfamily sugar epimerase